MKENALNKKQLCVISLVASFVFILCGVAFASSEGGGVHNSWLKIDTWKLLNFGVLAIAVFLIVKKPVAEFFSSRAKGIEEGLADLENKKAEAEKKLAEYQAKFKNLDEESKQIIEDYIKQGEEAKKRILSEAEAQAEKLEVLAKRNIDQEFKTAKANLQEEIVEKAMESAESFIKKSISSKDQNKLVDDYLRKVVA
jgi:F-type H+-transporting ATPase subunit b